MFLNYLLFGNVVQYFMIINGKMPTNQCYLFNSINFIELVNKSE